MNYRVNNDANPLKKYWIIHDREMGVTSIIRYIDQLNDGNYMIAVSRAFKHVNDKMFSRPAGREHAMNRMKKFFSNKYRKTSRNRRRPFSIKSKALRDPVRGEYEEVTLFEIGEETILSLHEMEVWHNKILPKIEEEMLVGW